LSIRLGERVTARRTNLIHPVHQQLVVMVGPSTSVPARAAIDEGDIVDAKSMIGYFFWKRSLRKG
jgi:hypothetical protein